MAVPNNHGKPFIEKWDSTANSGSGDWVAVAESNAGMPYSAYGNPWMWTGQRYYAAGGLHHTLFRDFRPELGRWLQRDPIEYQAGSINLYEYVLSSPLSDIDPLGLFPPGFPPMFPPPTPTPPRTFPVKVMRIDVNLFRPNHKLGHTWIEWKDAEGKTHSFGWWYAGDCPEGNLLQQTLTGVPGERHEPEHPTQPPDHEWPTKPTGKPLQYRPGQGKDACHATDKDVTDCIKSAADDWQKKHNNKWALLGSNCRDFVNFILRKCGLKK